MKRYYTPEPTRVYTADELDDAPKAAIDRACLRNTEAFEPQWVTDDAVSFFNETHREHGIKLESGRRHGPFWSVGSQGEGASLTVTISDFAAYLRWRGADRHVARRLVWLFDEGDVTLAFAGRSGNYCGTHAIVGEYYSDGRPGEADRADAVAWLESDARDAAADLEAEFMRDVRADYEYAGSREQLENELRDLGQGLTESGEIVDLSECQGSNR